jgi:branched-chain amino acid transport system substrate-binding protein
MRKLSILALVGLAVGMTLSTVSLQAADTLKIGIVAPTSGAAAEAGRYEMQGAKLAVEEINKAGGVLGKQIELISEDDQTTNPGAVMAFSKLVGNKDIAAFIGTVRSTQMMAIAPDVLKIRKPVMIGGTDPELTHLGNPWLFRFRPNDTYSARVIADYVVKTLGKKKVAIVNSTDAFGTAGMKALVAALKNLGVEPVLVQGYANQSQDFTPVALAVKRSGADIMCSYMTYETDLGIFAKQLRQLGVTIPWVGSPSTVTITALRLAGPALYGTYAVSDFHKDSSPASQAYATKYQAAYNVAPDFLSAWAYDAVHVIAMGINNAKSTDPEKIRQGILAIKGYNGAEGTYNFDKNGDGLHGYNIVRNNNGTIVFDKRINFTD